MGCLYTDNDSKDANLYTEPNDFISDLKGEFGFFWRPDTPVSIPSITKRSIIGENFVRIGSRMRTHSMIIRRSEMKKILDFIKDHHLFLPYDNELSLIPGINLFSLKSNIVSFNETVSDTKALQLIQKNTWSDFKKRTLEKVPEIMGWYNLERANSLLEFLKEKKPKICVEIGAFAGSTSYQIAETLNFLQQGILYAIDAWDSQKATEGLKKDTEISLWKTINMQNVKKACESLFSSNLGNFCKLIHKSSVEAVNMFSNEEIDFLFIDGNTSDEGSLEDVTLYFPKVKPMGYICLKVDHHLKKTSSIAFLMEHGVWLKEYSGGIDTLIFQKKQKTN